VQPTLSNIQVSAVSNALPAYGTVITNLPATKDLANIHDGLMKVDEQYVAAVKETITKCSHPPVSLCVVSICDLIAEIL
jgi:hypothetical protein